MLKSSALEVVIGLVFIYLLYSLLATIVTETIASFLNLRARHLESAIRRMLGDRLAESFYHDAAISQLNHPGGGKPSAIHASVFSAVLTGLLSGGGKGDADRVGTMLRGGSKPGNATVPDLDMEPEPAGFFLRLWEESGRDPVVFRKLLEEWFDRTMEQVSGWYRRKVRIILLGVGFLIAWLFGADTFRIVNKLGADHVAREQMTALAGIFAADHPDAADTLTPEIRRAVLAGLQESGAVLGFGGWPAVAVFVTTRPGDEGPTYDPPLDARCLSSDQRTIKSGTIILDLPDRLLYLARLGWYHFFGFLVTALALSLGAPFWFDLLSRIMQVRTTGRSVRSGNN